jgi:hypothetical protein
VRIEGYLTVRPAKDHPDPAHWSMLQSAVRAERGDQCATCWRTGDAHRLELHHRHYSTWGREGLADVQLLCVSCHDAITSRIRAERFARGDIVAAAEGKVGRELQEVATSRPIVPEQCAPDWEPEPTRERRRPAVRQVTID